MFEGITQWLNAQLDFIGTVFSFECAGLKHFHNQWLFQVIAMPVGMMTAAGVILLIERRHSSATAATAHFYANLFFGVFFCCKYTIAICRCLRAFGAAFGSALTECLLLQIHECAPIHSPHGSAGRWSSLLQVRRYRASSWPMTASCVRTQIMWCIGGALDL
jgi:hypothetical protein